MLFDMNKHHDKNETRQLSRNIFQLKICFLAHCFSLIIKSKKKTFKMLNGNLSRQGCDLFVVMLKLLHTYENYSPDSIQGYSTCMVQADLTKGKSSSHQGQKLNSPRPKVCITASIYDIAYLIHLAKI